MDLSHGETVSYKRALVSLMIVRGAINALTYIKDFHPIACCNAVNIHMSNNPN